MGETQIDWSTVSWSGSDLIFAATCGGRQQLFLVASRFLFFRERDPEATLRINMASLTPRFADACAAEGEVNVIG